MKKTPESPSSSPPVLSRAALFAVLMAGCDTAPLSGNAYDIPYCNELDYHSVPKTPPTIFGRVDGVVVCAVDGDTFDVRVNQGGMKMVRVRLWGVDCPESSNNSKCKRQNCNTAVGKKASNKVRKMLGDGRVTLEPPYKANGNRKLAYVNQNGGDFGRKMIQNCICGPGNYKHSRKTSYNKVGKQCR